MKNAAEKNVPEAVAAAAVAPADVGEVEDVEIRKRRMVAELASLPLVCRRNTCRRAGACVGADAACYLEHLADIRKHIFPVLRVAAREQLGMKPDPADDNADALADAWFRRIGA